MFRERSLVTGATGMIGRHLVDALIARGAKVRILTRGSRPVPPNWGGRVETAIGDLTEPASLVAPLKHCVRVFHLAGELRAPEHFWRVNATGTRNLLEAASTAGVRHVVHMSSVGVMGATRSGPVDESGPCHPRNAYEQSKLEAERLAMGWSVQFRIPLVALRPTIVFGARSGGDPDSFLGLLRAIKSRRFVYFDRLAIANYVYVEDVVAACLAGSARTARGVFIVADPCSLVDFGAAAAEALDVPAPRTHVPVLVAHGASVLLKALGTVLGRPSPLTPARVRALSNRTLFHSSTIEAALDWRPAIGYRAGLVRTVQAYCKAGSL